MRTSSTVQFYTHLVSLLSSTEFILVHGVRIRYYIDTVQVTLKSVG